MTRLITLLFLLVWVLPARAATEIQEVTSPGGITAWLTEEHSIPIVAIDMIFRGGASLDPVDRQGATYLMTGMLEEGTGDLDATAFAEQAQSLAARFGFDAGRDTVSVSAQMLRENLAPSVDLLRRALSEPRFDDDALQRVKAQVASIIRSDETDPDAIASARFRAMAFGDHPYGRPLEGTLDSLEGLTADDLEAARRRALVTGQVYIGVVGDITAAELGPLLDTLLGALPVTGPAQPAATEMLPVAGIEIIDFPTPQSVAVFGHGGIARDDPDYLTAYVMNHILGDGGSTARLTREVRENRGLTYGIASFLAPMDGADLYLGSFRSGNDSMAEAIDLVRAEWRRMAEGGVSDEELQAAKQFLTGAYPLRFRTNADIAGILAGLQFAGLGKEYVEVRNDLVNAVTTEDIARVARRLLHPEDLLFVVVGQPAGLPE